MSAMQVEKLRKEMEAAASEFAAKTLAWHFEVKEIAVDPNVPGDVLALEQNKGKLVDALIDLAEYNVSEEMYPDTEIQDPDYDDEDDDDEEEDEDDDDETEDD